MSRLPTHARLAGRKWTFTDCPACSGTGNIVRQFVGAYTKRVTVSCPDCKGRGYQRSFRTSK